METVTEQPIKKIEFFRCPQSLPGVAPLTKKPEDSGYEIDGQVPFTQRADNFIQRITRSPADKMYFVGVDFMRWLAIYRLDSVIRSLNSRGRCFKNGMNRC